VSKDSYWLLTEEKGFRVLNGEFIVFPLSMNTVILKHVCLHKQNQKIQKKKIRSKSKKAYNTRKINIEERIFYHVISGDERIVNSNEFNIISLQSNSCNQTSDSSKSYQLQKTKLTKIKKYKSDLCRNERKSKELEYLPLIPILILADPFKFETKTKEKSDQLRLIEKLMEN